MIGACHSQGVYGLAIEVVELAAGPQAPGVLDDEARARTSSVMVSGVYVWSLIASAPASAARSTISSARSSDWL